MPYLVAVSSETEHRVLGYCYAGEFRPHMHAYDHTAELSIFVRPDEQGRGVGSMLMKTLLEELRVKHSNPGKVEGRISYEPVKGEIRNLLAVMSVDEHGWGDGLRDWYRSWGFEEKGRMEKVGWKLGRWVDVVIMQLKL